MKTVYTILFVLLWNYSGWAVSTEECRALETPENVAATRTRLKKLEAKPARFNEKMWEIERTWAQLPTEEGLARKKAIQASEALLAKFNSTLDSFAYQLKLQFPLKSWSPAEVWKLISQLEPHLQVELLSRWTTVPKRPKTNPGGQSAGLSHLLVGCVLKNLRAEELRKFYEGGSRFTCEDDRNKDVGRLFSILREENAQFEALAKDLRKEEIKASLASHSGSKRRLVLICGYTHPALEEGGDCYIRDSCHHLEQKLEGCGVETVVLESPNIATIRQLKDNQFLEDTIGLVEAHGRNDPKGYSIHYSDKELDFADLKTNLPPGRWNVLFNSCESGACLPHSNERLCIGTTCRADQLSTVGSPFLHAVADLICGTTETARKAWEGIKKNGFLEGEKLATYLCDTVGGKNGVPEATNTLDLPNPAKPSETIATQCVQNPEVKNFKISARLYGPNTYQVPEAPMPRGHGPK